MTRTVRKPIVFLLSFMLVITYTFGGGSFAFAETYSDSDKDKAAVEQDLQKDAEPAAQNEDADAAEDVQQNSGATEAAPAQEAQGAVEEPASVAFAESATVDGVKVKVTADKGVFPEGATLKVKKLSAKEEAAAKKAIDKIADKADVAKQYNFDISVFDKNGNEIQPDTSKGSVNVAFKTDEVADDSLKAEVFHIADNGKAEALNVETKGEVAKVETEGFSAYSLRFINSSDQSLEFDLVMNGGVWLSDILDSIGMESLHYDIDTAQAPSSVVRLTHEDRTTADLTDYEDYWVEATGYNLSGDHALEVSFYNHSNIVILIKTHVHNWNLHTEGGTAMLECTAEGCPHPQYTWTLTASDVTYDGNPHYANLSAPELKGNDVNVSSIVYYSGTSTTPMTDYPVDAGDYRAVVTIDPDNGTHEDARTISASFRINKADITVTAPAAIPNLVYSRTWQNLHNAGSAKSATTSQTFTMMYAKGTETEATETYAAAIEQGFNAGDYWIWYYVPGDSNHNASAPAKIKASIAKKPVVVQSITGINKVYDGTDAASVDVSEATFNGKCAGDILTINAEAKFRSNASEGLIGKNVGTNKVIDLTLTFGGQDAENYTLDVQNSQKNARADITKKDVEASWDEATELQYTGDYQAPIADLMVTEVINNNDKKIYKVDEGKVSISVTGKQKNVGKGYKAYVGELEGDEAGNYNLINKTTPAEFSIIPKELTASWTNTTQEYDAKGLKPGVELTGFVNDEAELVKSIADTMNIEAVEPTQLVEGEAYDAGSYVATVALEDAEGVSPEDSVIGNYTLTNPTSDFKITKAPLTVKAKGWVYYGTHVAENSNNWIKELEYDKNGITGFKGDDGTEVLTAIEDGTVRFDSNYEFSAPATGVKNPKTGLVAKYYLYPEFDEADNYEITNADGELTVYPKPVTLKWTHTHNGKSEVVSGDQSFVYDGKLHKYTAKVSEDSYVHSPSGMPLDPEMTVTVQANIQRDANVKTGTEKYTAYAAELSNPNYALVEIVEDGERTEKDVETRDQDFFIDQLPVELSWKPAEFTYNAESQRPTPTVENLQTDDEGTVDEPFEITFTPKPEESINADNYVARVTDLADLNYSILATPTEPMSDLVPTSAFDYTIKKAPLTIQPVVDPISYKDEAPAEYEPSVEGLQGEDTVDSIGLRLEDVTFTCPYVKNEKPGNYSVETTMDPVQELQNYEIMLNNGTLAVKDKVTKIVAKATAKGKKKGVITWNAVTGAKSYTVYMSKCNKGKKHYKLKKVATVKGTKYTTKKLKKKSCYKLKVVANTNAGSITSLEAHFATGNVHGKYTNTKKLTVNRSSVTLDQGKAFKLKCKATKVKKGKRLSKHAKRFRFISDNPEVAKVSAGGTITAVGHGWCRVYVQAVNGMWKTVQVNVK